MFSKKLLTEWHSSKNHPHKLNDFTSGSGFTAWWKCPVADDHVWTARIYARVAGNGCPFCSGKKVCVDNALSTLHKEVASQWHYEKNKPYTPDDFTSCASYKAWWKCINGHEWKVRIADRTKNKNKGTRGNGCLQCKKKTFIGEGNPRWKGFHEISGNYISRLHRNAKLRNMKFKVTSDCLWKLFESQGRCCALTGLPIGFDRNNQTASLDRIDSSKGYIPSNIQWVHKDLQDMKWDLIEEKFLRLCKLVVDHKS